MERVRGPKHNTYLLQDISFPKHNRECTMTTKDEYVQTVVKNDIIIEPHGRGVPSVVPNDRSPRPGLPE